MWVSVSVSVGVGVGVCIVGIVKCLHTLQIVKLIVDKNLSIHFYMIDCSHVF